MTSYIDILLQKTADEGRAVPLVSSEDKAKVMHTERVVLTYIQETYKGDANKALNQDFGKIELWIMPNAEIAAKHFREESIDDHVNEIIFLLSKKMITLPPEVRNSLIDIYHDPKGGCNSYTSQDF